MIPQVGQIMFLAYLERRDQGREHEVVVTKVGRKWATIYPAHVLPENRRECQARRFDITDPKWFVDGGKYSSGARVWPSQKAWGAEKSRDFVYTALRGAISRTNDLHPDVTTSNVREAIRLLGLTKEAQAEMLKAPEYVLGPGKVYFGNDVAWECSSFTLTKKENES